MRRVRVMLMLLVLLLAACGGGSDSDDGDSGGDSSGGGGGAAAAATTEPTGDDPEATASDSLAQVTSDAAPMPDPEGASGVRPILTDPFDDAQSSSFLVDEFENGTMTEVVDGTYTVTPEDGMTQIMLPTSIPAVNNGVIVANVSVAGNGAAGVTVRTRKDPQGTFSGYVCWISEPAGAGCSLNAKDTYTLLFSAPADSVQLQESNVLRVAMIDDQLQFEVNDQVIGRFADTTYVSGNWGLYAESAGGGTATGTYDDVVVYRITGGFELP